MKMIKVYAQIEGNDLILHGAMGKKARITLSDSQLKAIKIVESFEEVK